MQRHSRWGPAPSVVRAYPSPTGQWQPQPRPRSPIRQGARNTEICATEASLSRSRRSIMRQQWQMCDHQVVQAVHHDSCGSIGRCEMTNALPALHAPTQALTHTGTLIIRHTTAAGQHQKANSGDLVTTRCTQSTTPACTPVVTGGSHIIAKAYSRHTRACRIREERAGRDLVAGGMVCTGGSSAHIANTVHTSPAVHTQLTTY